MSTRIDFDSAVASIDTLMSVGPYFRLDHDGELEILAEVARSITRWRNVAASVGLPQHELELMAPAFEHPEADLARQLIGTRSTHTR